MAIETDNSSVAFPSAPYSWNSSNPITGSAVGTYRGLGSSWFNAENIAAEDYMRSEQSAYNAWQREFYTNQYNNAFNAQQAEIRNAFEASEAEKYRQFEHDEAELAYKRNLESESTKYQRAIADMKKAGLNPALLSPSASGVDAPMASGSAASGAAASSGSGGSGGRSNQRPRGNTDPLVGMLGFVGQIASMAVSGSLRAQSIMARTIAANNRIASREKIAAAKIASNEDIASQKIGAQSRARTSEHWSYDKQGNPRLNSWNKFY